MNVDNKY